MNMVGSNYFMSIVLGSFLAALATGDAPEEDHITGSMVSSLITHYVTDSLKSYIEAFVAIINEIGEYFTGVWDRVEQQMDKLVNYTRAENCHFTCPHGLDGVNNENYAPHAPGCMVFGVHMGNCCKGHTQCYGSCGEKKRHCDDNFIDCLTNVCVGIADADKRHGCRMSSKMALVGAFTFGCRYFKDYQKESCVCLDRDEL